MFNSLEEARAYLPPQDVDCIVYHNACADGITSAFAGWRHQKGKVVHFVPATYDAPFSVDQFPGKNVLIVDFSYTKAQLEELEKAGKKVLVLDHHEKAFEQLTDYPHGLVVDEQVDSRSGAGLSWNYFSPKEPLPLFVQLVQDRDVWDFALPDTNAFGEVFWEHISSFTFKGNFPFEKLEPYLQEDYVKSVLPRGQALYLEKMKRVQEKCAPAILRSYEDKTFWFVHSKNGSDRSEIGHALCERGIAKFAAIWWEDPETAGKYHVSFRSSKFRTQRNEEFNVNVFAKQFGGGGHRNASSCNMTTHPETKFLVVPQQRMHIAYQQEKQADCDDSNNPLKRKFDKI